MTFVIHSIFRAARTSVTHVHCSDRHYCFVVEGTPVLGYRDRNIL